MAPTPLRFYAVGWAAEELQASPAPADFPEFPEAVWVHTGADWIPLSPVVAAVWRQARAIPVTEDAVLAVSHAMQTLLPLAAKVGAEQVLLQWTRDPGVCGEPHVSWGSGSPIFPSRKDGAPWVLWSRLPVGCAPMGGGL